MIDIALVATDEARTLAATGGAPEQIVMALDVVLKALRGEPITDDDIDGLHPVLGDTIRAMRRIG